MSKTPQQRRDQDANIPQRRGQGIGIPLDPELVQKLVENQTRELEVRQQELILQQQQIVTGHEFSQLSLKAQLEDRERNRQHFQKYRRERLYFGGFIAILLTGFIIYSLQLGKDAFAIEVLKALVFLLSGGISGYALKGAGKSEAHKNDPPQTGK